MNFWITILILAFPGERLEYEIRYGPLVVGDMVLQHLEPKLIAGEQCEHLRADLLINQNLSWFFWAQYRLESWCRSSDWRTLRAYKKTIERNYQGEYYVTFFHDSGFARYSDGQTVRLYPSARDLLTLWYFLREFDWGTKESLKVKAHIDRRNWNISLRCTGRQVVRTRAGDFDCLAITPRTSGPLGTVFLSSNERRVPVAIRTRVGGLTVTAFLRKITIDE